MMKKLRHIWMILMALACALAGCHGTPEYDSRLTQADSLMSIPSQRKTALDQLINIPPNSLTKESDKAYLALLLTQARYKNYERITSDEVINSAIEYYEHHSKDQEKLTRAYIYKGAVLEDLEKPDSAMWFYKKAEVTASEEDDYNRGYAQLRMGKLYYGHHAYDGRDIEKLEQALESFRKSKDIHYQIVCLSDLGAMYRSTIKKEAEQKLTDAFNLAKTQKDTLNMIKSLKNLAYLYFMQSVDNKEYIRPAYDKLQEIKALKLNGLRDDVYTTFASIYANCGKVDSAMWFLQLSPLSNDSAYLNSNNYLEAMSQIYIARGDSINYLKTSYQCDRNSFKLLRDPYIVKIMTAELQFDEHYKNEQDQKRRTRNYFLWAIASAIILSLLLLALLLYLRNHRYDKLVLELKDQSQNQMQDLTDMQQSINELQINDERLKGFISSHVGMMREIIEACYHEPNNRIAENMKRIVKFQDSNKDNWVRLFDYIDLEHNNIMTRTRENYPDLNDRELLLLALTCMGFTYIQIAIIMGYSNATSVSVIKQRLVKKMGLDCSLNEYIQNNENMKK